MRFFEDREAATAATEKLKVFAQPQRLMLLSALLDTERTVGELAEATGITQPALSQQLAELRRAELVATRREARQVWYRLADESAARCVRTMEAVFGETASGNAAFDLAGSPAQAAPEPQPAPSRPVGAQAPVPGPTVPAPTGAAIFARML